MPAALWSNPLLLARAGTLQALLNSGHKLHLFSNNFTPDPTTPISSFVECTFPGYVAIDLTGLFTGPTLVQNGQYQLTTGTLAFGCTGLPGQTIYGWWIDDGTNMKACQLLDTPFPITPGVDYLAILRPQEITQSILP